jgi:hypothetical protein
MSATRYAASSSAPKNRTSAPSASASPYGPLAPSHFLSLSPFSLPFLLLSPPLPLSPSPPSMIFISSYFVFVPFLFAGVGRSP